MINYYKELNISRDLDVELLQKELTKQERVWHQREVNNPEKARRMLLLIDEARKVFISEYSKREYDDSLEKKDLPVEERDLDREQNIQREKWKKQCRDFLNNQELDLAKTAFEKAVIYDDGEDIDLYVLGGYVYRYTRNFIFALENINKAIILDPDKAGNYLNKATIYSELVKESKIHDYQKVSENISLLRNTCQVAIRKAEQTGDRETLACAMGYLAFSLYYDSPMDHEQAIQLAEQAIRLDDPWGNSMRVIQEEEIVRNRDRANEEKALSDIRHSLNTKRNPDFFRKQLQELNSRNWKYVTINPELRYEVQKKIDEAEQNVNEVKRLEAEVKRVENQWKHMNEVLDSPLLPIIVVVVWLALFWIVVNVMPGVSLIFVILGIVVFSITLFMRDGIANRISYLIYQGKYDALIHRLNEAKSQIG